MSKWPMKTIGEICKTSSGGTPSRKKTEYYNGNIPWVKSGELKDCIIEKTAETISSVALESSSAKLFPVGTLLIALYGATVGQLGILGIQAATKSCLRHIFQ
jgi:type I restriction enzyme S subunit